MGREQRTEKKPAGFSPGGATDVSTLACPVERLVRVAFCRSHVEHLFRIAKSELGFTHFEGRNMWR